MFSFTSSSNPPCWRRFFFQAVGAATLATLAIALFVALVDPFDTLPLSPAAHRWPVATDARYSFPALARSKRFDSAVFGTSTSRLLRPTALDSAFGAHFANLAMNSATPFEQSQLMDVFRRAHPDARMVMVGLDIVWCVTGDTYQKLTPRPFPYWMYGPNRWLGYLHLLNLYAVQEAGQQFGILIGIKDPVYGRDGYTSFVPPDNTYDPARAEIHLQNWGGPAIPPGVRAGPPTEWRYPALETLRADLARLPPSTRKVLFFVPYNHVLLPAPGSDAAAVWNECKRRVGELSATVPNMLVVDFMRPSPITDNDRNYWDPLHYRIGIADRLVQDLAAAANAEGGPDDAIVASSWRPETASR